MKFKRSTERILEKSKATDRLNKQKNKVVLDVRMDLLLLFILSTARWEVWVRRRLAGAVRWGDVSERTADERDGRTDRKWEWRREDECEHLGWLNPTLRCLWREVAPSGPRDAVTVKGRERHAGVGSQRPRPAPKLSHTGAAACLHLYC